MPCSFVVLAAALATFSSVTTQSWAEPTYKTTERIPLVPEGVNQSEAPKVISSADAMVYRQIFALQKDGEWATADGKIATLEDRILMGHVLFQRYMHPTAYRSSYSELAGWLARYADHPEARRIHRLALKRRPAGAKAPKRPMAASLSLGPWSTRPGTAEAATGRRGPVLSRQERQIVRKVARLVGQGKPSAALELLRKAHANAALRPFAYDTAQTQIAAGYFYAGKDEKAFQLASKSAERSRAAVESADWIAGLAAWRLRRVAVAGPYFEALARSETASPWNVSAGAYWAARSYLVSREPEKVNPLLSIGATHPRTFYGLLSARLLGKDLGLRWRAPPLTRVDAELLLKMPAIKRVIALAAAERYDLADRELRGLYLSGREALGAALVGLANRLHIPATQLRLAQSYVEGGGRAFDAALFPMPPWKPKAGYLVDRALIFAFMRQESGFVVKAKSQAGARGLMQLMPRTASFVAKDRSLRGRGKYKLLAPEFNIGLGQRYLTHLLAIPRVRGNLFYLAVAYNSGPTNLRRWLDTIPHGDDPLLFIESIPSRETRFFVERMMANFWIYRERLRQDSPSLDAVATGHWPIYLTLDKKSFKLAGRNAGN
jgi:soluble lytic murein transglycosylase-like protein